jgi:hypothetical protein
MRIRSIAAACAIASTVFGGVASEAQAITWTLTNVPLTDGGTLSGTFSTDVYGYINHSYSLATTGGSLGSQLDTYYLGPNEPVGPQFTLGSNIVDFFSNINGYQEELQLAFLNPITDPTNSIVSSLSFECFGWTCPSSVTRYVGSDLTIGGGNLQATPLPSAWTATLIGLLALFVGTGFKLPRSVVTRQS